MMEVVKDAQPDQFPKFSSPTSHVLPPGRYLMWTREPQSNMLGRGPLSELETEAKPPSGIFLCLESSVSDEADMRMSLPKDVPENWNRWIHRTIWCSWLRCAFCYLRQLEWPSQSTPHLVVVRLAIAALVGLMSLPLKLWSQRKHLRIWGAVATVFSLLSIMSLFLTNN
jgi:hypothetical protein